MGKDIPKEKIKSFLLSTTGIKSASEIAVVDDCILVSDQQHCLFVLDLEGNVLEKLGRQGTGPMEFSRPERIIWREEDQLTMCLIAAIAVFNCFPRVLNIKMKLISM